MSEDSAANWLLAAFADPARELWGLISGGLERQVTVGRLPSPAAGATDGEPTPRWTPASELALISAGSTGPVSATVKNTIS